MMKRAVTIVLALAAGSAHAWPGQPPSPPPIEPAAPVDEPVASEPPEPEPPAIERRRAPPPPPIETAYVPPVEVQAPSCEDGARWYVETSFFLGSLRFVADGTTSSSVTRVALSSASGLMYRGCSGTNTPGVNVRFGAYFEVREQLPIGVEAQVDYPSGGYRLGGRVAAMKALDGYQYTPWELTAGFRARRGILLFGVDVLYATYDNQDVTGTSFGVLAGIGIQARPDAD